MTTIRNLRKRGNREARRPSGRRAFSLFELLAVLLLIGLVATMAIPKFGHSAYQSVDAERFARQLALDFSQARRRAITTGDDHILYFQRSSGAVTGYVMYRDATGGEEQADELVTLPAGATATTATDVWRLQFDGSLSTAGTNSIIRIDGAKFYWNVTVYHATGWAKVDKIAQP